MTYDEQNIYEFVHPDLREQGITTYGELFALIRDESADSHQRFLALDTVSSMRAIIDKRRVVRHLLAALRSPAENIRQETAHVLGMLRSRRAILPLIAIACDKSETEPVRLHAILALFSIHDPRAIAPLTTIMFDKTDDLRLRAEAIAWTSQFTDGRSLDDYIALLADESADIRFWAAFGLVNLQNKTDISPALNSLDPIVAFDDAITMHWGWQVGREALQAFEDTHFSALNPRGRKRGSMRLISPAPEYWTLAQEYRQWTDDGRYAEKPIPPITLHVDPDWMAEKLRERWTDVAFSVRQTQAYVLDWTLHIDGQFLMGGLHRDHYALVVSGENYEIVKIFARWYRSIIPADVRLFTYGWAEPGEELLPNKQHP